MTRTDQRSHFPVEPQSEEELGAFRQNVQTLLSCDIFWCDLVCRVELIQLFLSQLGF